MHLSTFCPTYLMQAMRKWEGILPTLRLPWGKFFPPPPPPPLQTELPRYEMLKVTILNHLNTYHKALPTLNTEPTFMRAIQKCPIYLGMHTYSTCKSELFPKTNTLLFMQQIEAMLFARYS